MTSGNSTGRRAPLVASFVALPHSSDDRTGLEISRISSAGLRRTSRTHSSSHTTTHLTKRVRSTRGACRTGCYRTRLSINEFLLSRPWQPILQEMKKYEVMESFPDTLISEEKRLREGVAAKVEEFNQKIHKRQRCYSADEASEVGQQCKEKIHKEGQRAATTKASDAFERKDPGGDKLSSSSFPRPLC
ncbi:unnamed protein product [Ectocarpus sp. CCAP 1310/34]|nr:unnamed protein product [Ectocarpus sp. CCAP 1310/34]